MVQPSEGLPGCAAQIGMLGVIVSAIMVIMIGYLMVGISGYLAFPTTVEGNVLNSFTRGDVIMQVVPIFFSCIALRQVPCIELAWNIW